VSPQDRNVYVTFAALSGLAILLAQLLLRPTPSLKPVRGAPAFELDEPVMPAAGAPPVVP